MRIPGGGTPNATNSTLDAVPGSASLSAVKISVIIPAINEKRLLALSS